MCFPKKRKRDFEEYPQTCVWRLELLLGPVNANECKSERAAAMRYKDMFAFFPHLCLRSVLLFFVHIVFFSAHTNGHIWVEFVVCVLSHLDLNLTDVMLTV